MRQVETIVARPVNIVINGSKSKSWARIRDARTGKVLHTGQVPYITRLAKQRFNVVAQV